MSQLDEEYAAAMRLRREQSPEAEIARLCRYADNETNKLRDALRRLDEQTDECNRYRAELAKFAEWLERDRREPDKVLCVVQSMRRAAR